LHELWKEAWNIQGDCRGSECDGREESERREGLHFELDEMTLKMDEIYNSRYLEGWLVDLSIASDSRK
jgi:hypothetical protein